MAWTTCVFENRICGEAMKVIHFTATNTTATSNSHSSRRPAGRPSTSEGSGCPPAAATACICW